jgi:hypothetical protein
MHVPKGTNVQVQGLKGPNGEVLWPSMHQQMLTNPYISWFILPSFHMLLQVASGLQCPWPTLVKATWLVHMWVIA